MERRSMRLPGGARRSTDSRSDGDATLLLRRLMASSDRSNDAAQGRPNWNIAKGRDISCKCGLVNLQIECCNVVKKWKHMIWIQMSVKYPSNHVTFKLLLTDIDRLIACLWVMGVDEASASNKIALSSLTGCSLRNSSTVLSSYESKMKSAREEQKRGSPWTH